WCSQSQRLYAWPWWSCCAGSAGTRRRIWKEAT
ncbi:MAG: hypothetical protein AVDCRST_MAG26-3356, partial [uncultured Chloroflexia bacterium]